MQLRNGFQAQCECTSEHEQKKKERKKRKKKKHKTWRCIILLGCGVVQISRIDVSGSH